MREKAAGFRRPFSLALEARPFCRGALQRLPAFGGGGAAVLVGVAAGKIAIGLAHELGFADRAVPIRIHAAEEGILSLERAVALLDHSRRLPCARGELVLAQLAILVGVELLET